MVAIWACKTAIFAEENCLLRRHAESKQAMKSLLVCRYILAAIEAMPD